MNEVKSGVKTSEFWVSLLVGVSPVLVMMFEGLFGQFQNSTDFMYVMVAACLAGVIAVFKYIGSRTDLKKEVLRAAVLSEKG